MNPSDSNGSWLYTSIRVIKTIKREFFNIKTNITTEFESTLVIVLKQLFLEGSVNIVEYVVDYSKIFTSPSANNLLNDFKAW